VERNNNALVATWGNLGNRMLSFAYKRFDGVVPEPGDLDDEDRALLEKVAPGFDTIGELHNAVKLRAALGEVLALAREANGYLDRKAPWFQIKTDPKAAATTVGRGYLARDPAGDRQSEDAGGAGAAAFRSEDSRVPGVRGAIVRDAEGGGVPGRDAEPRGVDI
jgi:hypothetical protein